jgi:pimeloyl-ACP methyl ester carboxylesterase
VPSEQEMDVFNLWIFQILCVINQITAVTNQLTVSKDLKYSYPFLILPGFAQSHRDYEATDDIDSEGFVQILHQNGIKNVEVANIHRTDWLKIGKCLSKACFWKGSCAPHEVFGFYLEEVYAKISSLKQESGKPVVLIGHSAGGWLARAILGDGKWNGRDYDAKFLRSTDMVCGLISLGTPHRPPLDPCIDPSRGALTFVDQNYPGAYLKKQGNIFYLSIAGSAVRGSASAPRGSIERFAAKSYKGVNGNPFTNGEEDGDGIVPVDAALLPGSYKLTLRNVWHGAFTRDTMWYGSSPTVEKWLPPTLTILNRNIIQKNEKKIFSLQ